MFISPALSKPEEVLAVLVHEMIHAEVGVQAKHGKEFKERALAVGLEGRMTATTAGEELAARLLDLADELGDYPHDSLQGKTTGKKKDGTRQLKLECPVCGYIVRTSAKWIEVGLPACPCGETLLPEGVAPKPKDEGEE
jgi:rubrerythrin